MVSSGMLRRVALVRTDVSKELSASFIRVMRIGELGTTLAVTSNRCTLILRHMNNITPINAHISRQFMISCIKETNFFHVTYLKSKCPLD
jgi:hypothetical protein